MILLSTSYMPSRAYMALMVGAEGSVAVERWETYHRQTMRNRCMIATANGIKTLSVPVVCPQGNHTKTGQVNLSLPDLSMSVNQFYPFRKKNKSKLKWYDNISMKWSSQLTTNSTRKTR